MRTIRTLDALNWYFTRLENPQAALPAPESSAW